MGAEKAADKVRSGFQTGRKGGSIAARLARDGKRDRNGMVNLDVGGKYQIYLPAAKAALLPGSGGGIDHDAVSRQLLKQDQQARQLRQKQRKGGGTGLGYRETQQGAGGGFADGGKGKKTAFDDSSSSS